MLRSRKTAAPPPIDAPEWSQFVTIDRAMDSMDFGTETKEVRTAIHEISVDEQTKLFKIWKKLPRDIQEVFVKAYRQKGERPVRQPYGGVVYASKMFRRRADGPGMGKNERRVSKKFITPDALLGMEVVGFHWYRDDGDAYVFIKTPGVMDEVEDIRKLRKEMEAKERGKKTSAEKYKFKPGMTVRPLDYLQESQKYEVVDVIDDKLVLKGAMGTFKAPKTQFRPDVLPSVGVGTPGKRPDKGNVVDKVYNKVESNWGDVVAETGVNIEGNLSISDYDTLQGAALEYVMDVIDGMNLRIPAHEEYEIADAVVARLIGDEPPSLEDVAKRVAAEAETKAEADETHELDYDLIDAYIFSEVADKGLSAEELHWVENRAKQIVRGVESGKTSAFVNPLLDPPAVEDTMPSDGTDDSNVKKQNQGVPSASGYSKSSKLFKKRALDYTLLQFDDPSFGGRKFEKPNPFGQKTKSDDPALDYDVDNMKMTSITQHKDPEKLPPRTELRSHLDEDVKKELAEDKQGSKKYAHFLATL